MAASTASLPKIGAARIEVDSASFLGKVMLGWGDTQHRAARIATPIYARCVWIETESSRIAMVCLDLCFISDRLRKAVIEALEIKPEEILLTATHTHSGPGGYSGYVFYELTGGGFDPDVFQSIVSAIVTSVKQARLGSRQGTFYWSEEKFPDPVPVAFNRSIRAYNRNPEVRPVQRHERNLAVDRRMLALKFESVDGTPIAVWTIFPVHATSMHPEHQAIHSDNKGLAACFLEKEMEQRGHQDFVAVFSQGAAGDVSPNYQYFKGIKNKRGTSPDDHQSCRDNAVFQYQHALKLMGSMPETPSTDFLLRSAVDVADLSQIEVDPEFVDGAIGIRTAPAEIGLPQIRGTAEGGGAPRVLFEILAVILRTVYFFKKRTPGQGNKIPVLENAAGRVFGCSHFHRLPLNVGDPNLDNFRNFYREGKLFPLPWSPSILPIQIVRLGEVALAAVPAEFTTISGQRLERVLMSEFGQQGIKRVCVQGYSNAHTSYVVTPEEYDQQSYEGGCTHFGKWTLPAYLTLFKRLAARMVTE